MVFIYATKKKQACCILVMFIVPQLTPTISHNSYGLQLTRYSQIICSQLVYKQNGDHVQSYKIYPLNTGNNTFKILSMYKTSNVIFQYLSYIIVYIKGTPETYDLQVVHTRLICKWNTLIYREHADTCIHSLAVGIRVYLVCRPHDPRTHDLKYQ